MDSDSETDDPMVMSSELETVKAQLASYQLLNSDLSKVNNFTNSEIEFFKF